MSSTIRYGEYSSFSDITSTSSEVQIAEFVKIFAENILPGESLDIHTLSDSGMIQDVFSFTVTTNIGQMKYFGNQEQSPIISICDDSRCINVSIPENGIGINIGDIIYLILIINF